MGYLPKPVKLTSEPLTVIIIQHNLSPAVEDLSETSFSNDKVDFLLLLDDMEIAMVVYLLIMTVKISIGLLEKKKKKKGLLLQKGKGFFCPFPIFM